MLSKYLWAPAFALVAVALAALPVGNPAWAGSPADAFGLFESIPVPVSTGNTTNGMYSFDISWVDQQTQTYYLADRSNLAVDIVDAKTNKFLGQLHAVPPFAGISPPAFSTATAGPDGVTTSGHCLFVTDAPSRVVSFDTTSFPPTQVSSVFTATMDPNRADELAFDPVHSLILAINNADTPPFGTFIKVNPATCALTQPAAPGLPIGPATDRILFDAAHGVDAQNGAEQPIWDPATSRFYLSIPQIGSTPTNGGVVRINPTTQLVDNTYTITFCSPAGLTKGPNYDALVGCNTIWDTTGGRWTGNADKDAHTAAPIQVILNLRTGEQFRVGGVGVGDEVWFNSEDGNYYTASSGSPLVPNAITPARPPLGTAATAPTLTAQGAAILGVIDATSGQVLQLVPTFNVPAVSASSGDLNPHPSGTAHSVAADGQSGQVFVPLAANNAYPDCLTGCIAVYARSAREQPIEAVFPPP
jgi:hypothetical protein